MPLTDAQSFAFGTDIRANTDPDVIAYLAAGQIGDIADWYNADDATKWVFKTSMDTDEANKAVDWDEVLSATTSPLSQLQQFTFDRLFKNGTLDPSDNSNRSALVNCFPGNGEYTATRAGLLALATRNPTKCEVLFITPGSGAGGGDGTAQGQAALLVFEGNVTNAEVDAALAATAP